MRRSLSILLKICFLLIAFCFGSFFNESFGNISSILSVLATLLSIILALVSIWYTWKSAKDTQNTFTEIKETDQKTKDTLKEMDEALGTFKKDYKNIVRYVQNSLSKTGTGSDSIKNARNKNQELREKPK